MTNTHEFASRSGVRWLVAATSLLVLAGALVAKPKPKVDQLDPQKSALHALDRLTFGPRPGDVQAVISMGVDKWIELQLHPEKIDNGAMTARLAPYRTLTMSAREMVLDFPPNQVVNLVMQGKLPTPQNPDQRAVYNAAIARVQQREKDDAAAKAALPAAASTSTAGPPAGPKLLNTDVPQAKQQERREAHSLVDDLAAMPPDQRMQRILSLTPQEQSDLTKGLPLPKRQALLAGLSPQQSETVLALSNPEGVVQSELLTGKLLRAVYSNRQLEEVLTDFWFNHFNIFINKGGPERYLITSYERDVIRPHVLGKFQDLLVATAQSPAMLFYLDNFQSEGPDSDAALGRPGRPAQHPGQQHRVYRQGPFGMPYPTQAPHPNPQSKPNPNAQQKPRSGLNENYARELMELHTLGVNGGYTQKDVTEVARVFTGWTIAEPQQGGGFVFKPQLHEPGPKTVLGHKIKENGEKEGLEVLNILAHNPSTARFISTKLAERFVADTPPQSLIDAMSKTFLKNDGDLRKVMETMFRSPEFWAPDAYRARVKTPLEFVASSLRATNADITDPQALFATLNRMGMPLYGMQPPTGYSTKSDVWVSSSALLDRMNFGLALAANRLPGVAVDVTKLSSVPMPTSYENDPYQMQLALEQTLLFGEVSRQTHEVIEQKTVAPATITRPANPTTTASLIAGLLLGSPEFQRK